MVHGNFILRPANRDGNNSLPRVGSTSPSHRHTRQTSACGVLLPKAQNAFLQEGILVTPTVPNQHAYRWAGKGSPAQRDTFLRVFVTLFELLFTENSSRRVITTGLDGSHCGMTCLLCHRTVEPKTKALRLEHLQTARNRRYYSPGVAWPNSERFHETWSFCATCKRSVFLPYIPTSG
jgi:hypothetical protein